MELVDYVITGCFVWIIVKVFESYLDQGNEQNIKVALGPIHVHQRKI